VRRVGTRADQRTAKILQHLEIDDVPDEEIDAVLGRD